MVTISSLELVAAAAWLVGAAFLMWGRTARGLRPVEVTFLVVIMTVVPVLGPVAAIGFVLRRRQQASA
jgi:hypothetical protein